MFATNYIAVLVAGVVSMAAGFLWYGPLFGKAWAKEMGWGTMTPEQEAAMKKQGMKAYPQAFIGSLVTAFVLYHTTLAFSKAMEAGPNVGVAVQVASFVWLGFIVPMKYGDKLWGGKSLKLFFIDAAYYLVNFCLMASVMVLMYR